MINEIYARSLRLGAAALLVAGLVSAPIQLTSQGIEIDVASAAHEDFANNDGNNGSGDNRSPLTGAKTDDPSNPNYKGKSGDSLSDGNFGAGDDKAKGEKNGNRGKSTNKK